jgi:hypothetical protein
MRTETCGWCGEDEAEDDPHPTCRIALDDQRRLVDFQEQRRRRRPDEALAGVAATVGGLAAYGQDAITVVSG